jgi:hypothetical protein
MKIHGAPIQCTRGKCSKAFHISCAREGAQQGIVYDELGEVEKDVVLVNVAPAPSYSAPMDIDTAPQSQENASDAVDVVTSDKETIRVVKKVEFQLLCPQHNPVGIISPILRNFYVYQSLRSSYWKRKRPTSRIKFGRTCLLLRPCRGSRFALAPAYSRFHSLG